MDIIRRVPAEIIHNILHAAGVNDNVTVVIWKNALSFLWVCREWRFVAEPMLFDTLLSGNEDDVISRSNHELFLYRCYFDNVKQIIVRDDEEYSTNGNGYPVNIDMMISFGRLVDDEDGQKDIDSLDLVARGVDFALKCQEHRDDYYYYRDSDDSDDEDYEYSYFYDQYGNCILYDEDELDAKCRNASINIASKLAVLCPNITHLVLSFSDLTITNKMLANVLVNSYMKQLVKLECSIPVADLKLNDGHNIQSLVLGDYDTQCGQLLQLPPRLVKNLSLSFEGGSIQDLFKHNDLAPISYGNLTRLELCSPDIDINETADTTTLDSRSAEIPRMALFPRLQTVVIWNKILSFASLKYLLQFPIKILRVNGSTQHMFQLNKHNLDSIDRLILGIDGYNLRGDGNAQTEFVRLTNTLLAKACNISEVHIELEIRYTVIDWTDINWINLTHLYVHMCKEVGQVFTALSKMPNLGFLSIIFHNYKQDTYDDTMECITSLKRNCTVPLQSRIKVLEILWLHEEPSAKFIEALEFLKWYIPELEKLTVAKR